MCSHLVFLPYFSNHHLFILFLSETSITVLLVSHCKRCCICEHGDTQYLDTVVSGCYMKASCNNKFSSDMKNSLRENGAVVTASNTTEEQIRSQSQCTHVEMTWRTVCERMVPLWPLLTLLRNKSDHNCNVSPSNVIFYIESKFSLLWTCTNESKIQ